MAQGKVPAHGRDVVSNDDERFNHTLAALVGIVEPEHAPVAATPAGGWLARLVRSRRGSVALGFAMAAAIGALALVGVRSLPVPIGRDEPASVTLALPPIERPTPLVDSAAPVPTPAPVATATIARRDEGATRRAGEGAPVRPARVAVASPRVEEARTRPTPQPAPDEVRPAPRPTMLAADNRPAAASRPAANPAPELAASSPAPIVMPPERHQATAVRTERERRDNIDELRQLRHQW